MTQHSFLFFHPKNLWNSSKRIPFSIKVLLGAILGVLLGLIFKNQPIIFSLKNEHLGQLGMLVIKALRMLATPLVFFAILESFCKVSFTIRQGMRLFSVCLLNVSVAMVIALTIMNVFKPGTLWTEQMNLMKNSFHGSELNLKKSEDPDAPTMSLGLMSNLSYYVPHSFLKPFFYNNVISVVFLALLCGAALARLKNRKNQSALQKTPLMLETLIEECFEWFVIILEMVVSLVPYAVCGVIAQIVGNVGLHVFKFLWIYLLTVLSGFIIHAGLYYPFIVWLCSKISPMTFFKKGMDAIVAGFSMNSSLAAVPVTLKCLTKNMGVSPVSARLGSLVGTNFNNDGITLFEATTAIFLTQALDFPLTFPQQGVIILASIMAGAGIAGIPEAGLIVLPLVLAQAGIPPELILTLIPFILPVDWILARCRSGVNVTSDMVVSILLDSWEKRHQQQT